MSEWRYFEFHGIREAREWAGAGGIAVHHTGFPYRHWSFTCHMVAQDEATLLKAAREIGCQTKWIQRRPGFLHFDIFGAPLDKALGRCGFTPAQAAKLP